MVELALKKAKPDSYEKYDRKVKNGGNYPATCQSRPNAGTILNDTLATSIYSPYICNADWFYDNGMTLEIQKLNATQGWSDARALVTEVDNILNNSYNLSF